MGKRFQYEWNDFSGGLFVGPIGSKQPMNTFTGTDVMACAQDGMLMPAGHLFEAHTSTPINNNDVRQSMQLVSTAQIGSKLIYMSAVSTLNYTNFDTWPAAITSASFGAAAVVAPSVGCMPFSTTVYWPTSTAPGGILDYNIQLVVGPANYGGATMGFVTGLTIFDQFVCAWGNTVNINRFYFSQAGSPSTWPTTNFVDVCPTQHYIKTMLVMNGELLIGCTDGWYAISGVLGATATKRKISNDGLAAAAPVNVAACRDGAVHSGPGHNGVALSILRGSTVYPLLYHRDDGEMLDSSFLEAEMRVVRSGAHVLVGTGSTAVTQRLFVRASNGTWRSHAVQVGQMAYSEINWHKYGYVALYNGANYILNRYELEPTSPVCRNASGVWRSSTATATLSEYRHNTEFEVKEMIAEFEYGYGGDATTTRSIGVAALTRGVIMEGTTSSTSFDAKVSSTLSRTLTLSGAASNERGVQRFTPSDGGRTLTLSPKVTLQGIKLRRLIAICEEV